MVLWLALPARAQMQFTGHELAADSGAEITLTSFFDSLPPGGFTPVRVTIRNSADRARAWDIRFRASQRYGGAGGFESTGHRLAVEAKSERTLEVMVPLPTAADPHRPYFPQITAHIQGPGVLIGESQVTTVQRYSGPAPQRTPYLAMSKALALRSWGLLKDACLRSGHDLVGGTVAPELFPADWRGWLGVTALWISEAEWTGLAPPARLAARAWVAQGGWVFISHETSSPPAPEPVGFGLITHVASRGGELPPETVLERLPLLNAASLQLQLSEGYQQDWGLHETVADAALNIPLVLTLMVGFAVLVGPLNLFWLAKRGQRHRLFWTTPLISLVASVVMGVAIILQDGVGGSGNRLTVVHFLPGEKQAVVVQEQVARTGVLVGRGFDLEDQSFLGPLTLTVTPLSDQGAYQQSGRRWNGDWFASRSVQGHFVATVRPSRAAVQLVGDDPPTLLSSLDVPLREVLYVDAAGQCWRGQDLQVGQPLPLQRQPDAQPPAWWIEALFDGGTRLERLTAPIIPGNRRSFLYGLAATPGRAPIETLPSIRWQEQTVLYLGPVS